MVMMSTGARDPSNSWRITNCLSNIHGLLDITHFLSNMSSNSMRKQLSTILVKLFRAPSFQSIVKVHFMASELIRFCVKTLAATTCGHQSRKGWKTWPWNCIFTSSSTVRETRCKSYFRDSSIEPNRHRNPMQ